jgi:two-component system, cell cycle sensor histidine kinase and response regulator CckA
MRKDRDVKFRLLLEGHPQPIWVFDIESQIILEANAAAAAFCGYTRDEFRGMRLAGLLGEDEAHRLADELHRSGVRSKSVRRYRTKSGRAIEAETAVHEIEYGGRPAAMAMLTDAAGGLQVEEQLRQTQKMEAVGMLAGGVAHDFNNLLTIITGYSHLILNNLNPGDPNHHAAAQIMKAGERAAALTKQLLAFSRRQVLQPRVLDLNDLVTGLSSMLQRLIGEDIDLRLALNPDLGRVNADPGQIEQVLMNLVVNARDAMPKGGSLTIETRNVELDESYTQRNLAAKRGPHVLLAVSDSGHGMDEATRSRLFEPFFTTKSVGKGTGLGLSTVFGIIQQSGGSLEVYSEPDHGTSVKVYLPRIDQPVSVEAKELRKKPARGTETILVVEDDEMVRHLVRETLAKEGYRVMDAADPVHARRMADSHKGEIQLLITDVVMPKVSGIDLALQIAARRPTIKVLYMSGYTDNAIVNGGMLEKEAAFLQKPFTPGVLTHKVREVLEKPCKVCKAGK